MSLNTTTARNNYIGNGATAVYAYGFKILSATDLKVTKRDTSDVEFLLVYNTDYTVTGVGSSSGGSITLTAGNLPTDYKLTIRRVRPLTQLTDIRNQGAFYPEIHEDAFDHQVMLAQQQQDELDRAIMLPETVTGVSTELPVPEAGKILLWNDGADGITHKSAASLGSIVTVGGGLELISGDIRLAGLVDASKYSSIKAAVTAIGAAQKTLMIYTAIDASLAAEAVTIPSNISVLPLQGGVIAKGSATSLTCNAPVVGNPMHQWLSGFAASEILGLKEAKVEWFGAVADGTTDNSTALQLAFDWWMQGSNRHLTMRGDYRANSQLDIYSPYTSASRNCVLDAYGSRIISYSSSAYAVIIGKKGQETNADPYYTGDGTQFQFNTIKGLKIQAGSTGVHTLLMIAGCNVWSSVFTDIRLDGHSANGTTHGLLIYGIMCYYNNFINVRVQHCQHAISINKDWYVDTTLTDASTVYHSNANKLIAPIVGNYKHNGIYVTWSAANRIEAAEFEAAIFTEMLTNGTFSTNTTGWTATTATLTRVTGGQDADPGYCLSVANSGANSGKAHQTITTTVGKLYQVTVYFKKGTAVGGIFSLGTSGIDSTEYDSTTVTDVSWTKYTYNFVATTTTAWLTCRTNSAVDGETSLWDTITFTEATVDVFFDTGCTDNYETGRHESGATFTERFASGVTGNFVAPQLTKNIYAAIAELEKNSVMALGSTNSYLTINRVNARYIQNIGDDPIEIIQGDYNNGAAAVYIDSTGVKVPSLIISGDTGGDSAAGTITLTGIQEAAGGGATTLPTSDATHGPSNVTGDGWIKLYILEQVVWIPYWND